MGELFSISYLPITSLKQGCGSGNFESLPLPLWREGTDHVQRV